MIRTAWVATLILMASGAAGAEDPAAPPIRVFAQGPIDLDAILARPYDADVPFGSTGPRLWASSPQGWGFGGDIHWLYLTNLDAFGLEVADEAGTLQPAKATHYPSHVHMEGATRAAASTASFTYATDNVSNPLSKPFRPEKRWTCWSSKSRDDWYAVDFGVTRRLEGVRVFFFDDAPGGGCRPPDSVAVERWDEEAGAWSPIEAGRREPAKPAKGENTITLDAPVEASKIRLVFRNAGDDFYTGLYGVEPIGPEPAGAATPLEIAADKFITADDVLVSVVTIRNPTDRPRTVRVTPILAWSGQTIESWRFTSTTEDDGEGAPVRRPRTLEAARETKLHDQPVKLRFRWVGGEAGRDQHTLRGGVTISDVPRALREGLFKGGILLAPGASTRVVAASEIRTPDEAGRLAEWTGQADPLAKHLAEHRAWFDRNLARFDCSDPWVTKQYYHRAYNLRKNMFDPNLGVMKYPTQAEGRWRSPWYTNAISYGAGHQVREARWLADPKYWQGHLRTWAENPKPDGVYPSHVRPDGPRDRQYTDWISSTAWDGHLVHPDRAFLAGVVDKLAANTRAWQEVYDPDDDGLLLVDSHWWTGMEYQPSFFYFSDFKPAKDFNEPAERVGLERVDLTAYNFGNANNVARIYRMLGRDAEAQEFESLAKKIQKAVAAKMWKPDRGFFYSLRASDDAIADVEEIDAVYPFYFGMFAPGGGHLSAWKRVLDPEQFWTPWPVASCSKRCPAYSQDNWPGDGRRTACMWNGPTWPHANSLVMTAMARTLRDEREAGSAESTLTREKLWELFTSFTRAQFRDQDLAQPWTGEYYHGETARWLTAERDYNHSTWLDVLIPDLLGLVPRADDVLEIDPLLPDGALDHFLLDGQRYHGRSITLAWDAPGGDDSHGDGRSGLDVYVDGKLVASSPTLARLTVDLAK